MEKVTGWEKVCEITWGDGLVDDVKDCPILKKYIAALDVMCIDGWSARLRSYNNPANAQCLDKDKVTTHIFIPAKNV